MLEKLTERRPVLTAAAIYTVVVVAVFWPAFTGQFLVGERSDMLEGYPPRAFAAAYLKAHHAFPQWDPHIFGGMPYLANTAHGDTFYPTFLLRLILPVHVGISLGFVIHILLAGVFMFLFLRELRLSWGAGFVGGAAYMFTGQVISMVSPGHDGKLFVSALLPLALLFLHQAVTRADWRRYLAFGAVVGLALITPHVQMTYYLLMAAGFFWAYLVFFEKTEQRVARPWWGHALLFGTGLGVGFAIAAIQLVPFFGYIPFTPRGEGGTSTGWEHAISWSMPPEELFNVLWPAFSGDPAAPVLQNYWGRNFFKLHSEYIGAVALILATFGWKLEGRRRLAWFFGFLAVYGTLFALGGATPFYYLPYYLLPGIKMTRAPSSIFVVVSFAVAALAALGTQALLAPAAQAIKRTPLYVWAGILAVGFLFAVGGIWESMMRNLAPAGHQQFVTPAAHAIIRDSLRVLVLGVIALGLIWQRLEGRLAGVTWAAVLGGLILLDLWSVERHYIKYRPAPEQALAADQVASYLKADSGVFRVAPGSNQLSLADQRSEMGYSGTEFHRYDELLGRQGDDRRYWTHPTIMRLLGVRYLVWPDTLRTPLLVPVDTQPMMSREGPVYVYRFRDAEPYSFLVPMAVKVPEDQQVGVIIDPHFDPRRYLLVSEDAPLGARTITQVPEPITTAVAVTPVRAGAYRIQLAAGAPSGSLLFFSENWHPGWSATVDGKPGQVLRAQHTLMGVPLDAGAKTIELEFRDPKYPLGRAITLVTLLGLLALAGQAWWAQRRNKAALQETARA
jgi:hypothetical protein